MKKQRLFLLGVSLLAIVSFLTLTKSSEVSDITRANIKALSAAPQMGPDGSNTGSCYSEIKLNDKYRVLICGSCTFTTGRGTRVGGTCGQ